MAEVTVTQAGTLRRATRSRGIIISLATVTAAAALATSGCGSRPLESAHTNGRIVFTSHRRLVSIDPMGKRLTTLTVHVPGDSAPSWAGWDPSGRRALFTTGYRDTGEGSLWAIEADGTDAHVIAHDADAVVSPSGRMIARLGNTGVDIMTSEGRVLRTVPVRIPENALFGDPFLVTWSPDERRVAFYGYTGRDDGTDVSSIYVVPIVGSARIVKIDTAPVFAMNPVWEPRGSKIAFLGNPTEESKETDLYVMNDDGRDVTDLARNVSSFFWSPDGKRIAFTRKRGIYVTGVDGGAAEISEETADSGAVAWSSDGRQLVFSAARGLVAIGADGRRPQLLTSHAGGALAWAPRERIVFTDGGDLWMLDPRTRGVRRLIRAFIDRQPLWSPNGKMLAFTRISADGMRVALIMGGLISQFMWADGRDAR